MQTRNATADADADVQRRVVDAFLAAAHDGDFDRLVAVLHPDVVLRRDTSSMAAGIEVRGAEQVARGAQSFSRVGLLRLPALVNGVAGAFCLLDGKPFAVMSFTVRGEKIVEIDILSDPDRISRLDLTVLDG